MNTPTPTDRPDPAPGEMPTAASILGATSITKADLLRIQALLVETQALVARMNFTVEEARRDNATGAWQRNHGAVLRATEEQYVAVKAEMNRLLEPRSAPVQPPISPQELAEQRCYNCGQPIESHRSYDNACPDHPTHPDHRNYRGTKFEPCLRRTSAGVQPLEQPPAFVTPPVETISPLPPGAVLVRKPKTALDLLRDELNRTRITSENIGDIRAKYIDDDDSEWNAAVRDWTAERENKPPLADCADCGCIFVSGTGNPETLCMKCAQRESIAARCVQCGNPVEKARKCYALPTCYACLPSPPPIPSILAASERDKAKFELAEMTRHRDEQKANRGHAQQRALIAESELEKASASVLKLIAERDQLIEIMWLDGPGEPHETIDQLKAQFAAGWVRKTQLDEAEKTIAAQHRLMASAEQRGVEKGRAESAPESYRLLETGEVIQEGDEVYGVYSWNPVTVSLGCVVNRGGKFRRPITGGAGLHEAATVSQEPVTASEGAQP